MGDLENEPFIFIAPRLGDRRPVAVQTFTQIINKKVLIYNVIVKKYSNFERL